MADTMKIESKFVTALAGKALKNFIKDKTGRDVNIRINRIEINIDDQTARVKLDGAAEMPKSQLFAILNNTTKKD